jgi:hypothetical protein
LKCASRRTSASLIISFLFHPAILSKVAAEIGIGIADKRLPIHPAILSNVVREIGIGVADKLLPVSSF